MPNLFLVMFGGAIGAGCRHLLGKGMMLWLGPNFPWGTLTANLVGGLLMGLLAGSISRIPGGGEGWRLFLGVGMLGGFTTFSSFSLETVLMLERGQMALGLGYVAISAVGAIAALAVGLALTRMVPA